jgi:hypothetical protein
MAKESSAILDVTDVLSEHLAPKKAREVAQQVASRIETKVRTQIAAEILGEKASAKSAKPAEAKTNGHGNGHAKKAKAEAPAEKSGRGGKRHLTPIAHKKMSLKRKVYWLNKKIASGEATDEDRALKTKYEEDLENLDKRGRKRAPAAAAAAA